MTISRNYLIIAGVLLVVVIGLVAWNWQRSAERVDAAMMRVGIGPLAMVAPKPEPVDWPERVIPYSEQPPSFVTPEFPPLPPTRPDPEGEEPVVINRTPSDWRPEFWQQHSRR